MNSRFRDGSLSMCHGHLGHVFNPSVARARAGSPWHFKLNGYPLFRRWNRILVLFALFLAPPSLRAADGAAASGSRIVVMISVDGLANFYFDDPSAQMPNIRAIAAAGAHADRGMHASTPTVTWPNHTTLVTGDNPARHGVVGNTSFDRATTKRIVLIEDPVFDKDQIVKVPTIYDIASGAGITTASIRWPASRNAKTLDWTMPDVAKNALLHQYSTPALITEAKTAGLWEEPPAKGGLVSDATCTSIFNMILHAHRPGLALLHLVKVDETEHKYGPRTPQAYAAIKEADGYVGEVWDELKKDYPDRATLLVVSDHGFSPIEYSIGANAILARAGLEKVEAIRVVGGVVRAVPQAGSCFIYILDSAHHDAIVQQVRSAFAGIEGIDKVLDGDQLKAIGVGDPSIDPHAPDMMLFAKEGYCFGDTGGGVPGEPVKIELKGTHGHDANLPDLHATFVAWGMGIRSGVQLGEVQNIDVAPTIATLLGLSMPGTDGKPLTAALGP